MRVTFALLLLSFLGFWLALTPPGLCPCWLLPDFTHPHTRPAEAHNPHPHDDLGRDQSSLPVPSMSLPALLSTALPLLLPAATLWLRIPATRALRPFQDVPSPPQPPPRLPTLIAFA